MPKKSLRKAFPRKNQIALLEALEDRKLFSAAATKTVLEVPSGTFLMGQTATFTAIVSPVHSNNTPITGDVEFFKGTRLLGTVPVGAAGTATFSVENLFKGINTLHAKYEGVTGTFAPSTSTGKNIDIKFGVPPSVGQGTLVQSTTSDGLQITTVVPGVGQLSGTGASLTTGTGTVISTGDQVVLEYTGYLASGKEFDSSLNPNRTAFVVTVGTTSLIQGFTEGLENMYVGETAVLKIPPAIGYGKTGSRPIIPRNATLYFIIDALQVVTSGTSTPALTLTGANSQPISANEPAQLTDGTDLGAVASGTASAVQTFALNLSGTSTLGVSFTSSGVTLTGPDANEFTLGPVLINGSGATFTIQFEPGANATGILQTATLNILTTNTQSSPEFSFPIQGEVAGGTAAPAVVSAGADTGVIGGDATLQGNVVFGDFQSPGSSGSDAASFNFDGVTNFGQFQLLADGLLTNPSS